MKVEYRAIDLAGDRYSYDFTAHVYAIPRTNQIKYLYTIHAPNIALAKEYLQKKHWKDCITVFAKYPVNSAVWEYRPQIGWQWYSL